MAKQQASGEVGGRVYGEQRRAEQRGECEAGGEDKASERKRIMRGIYMSVCVEGELMELLGFGE